MKNECRSSNYLPVVLSARTISTNRSDDDDDDDGAAGLTDTGAREILQVVMKMDRTKMDNGLKPRSIILCISHKRSTQ